MFPRCAGRSTESIFVVVDVQLPKISLCVYFISKISLKVGSEQCFLKVFPLPPHFSPQKIRRPSGGVFSEKYLEIKIFFCFYAFWPSQAENFGVFHCSNVIENFTFWKASLNSHVVPNFPLYPYNFLSTPKLFPQPLSPPPPTKKTLALSVYWGGYFTLAW